MKIPEPQEYAFSDKPKSQYPFTLGTVDALFPDGAPKIRFDGEEDPSEKRYRYLESYTPAIGHRVILASMSGTYVVLGRVV